MRFLVFITTTVFFSLLFNCEGNPEFQREVEFVAPVATRVINTQNWLDDSVKILKHEDTISYYLFYDKKNKTTTIVKEKDTIFSGFITKNKELFYLNRLKGNGTYSIYAFKFKDNSIVGFDDMFNQTILQLSVIESDNYKKFILDSLNSPLVYFPKKEGRNYFREVLEYMSSKKIIDTEIKTPTSARNYSHLSVEHEETKNDELTLCRIFPNPFRNSIKLKFRSESNFSIEIRDWSNALIHSCATSEKLLEIDLKDRTDGLYSVVVKDKNTNLSEAQIIIKNSQLEP